jgi:hypothetical protein
LGCSEHGLTGGDLGTPADRLQIDL